LFLQVFGNVNILIIHERVVAVIEYSVASIWVVLGHCVIVGLVVHYKHLGHSNLYNFELTDVIEGEHFLLVELFAYLNEDVAFNGDDT
jgi:hypothetical protein